jgi:hypothetical protein
MGAHRGRLPPVGCGGRAVSKAADLAHVIARAFEAEEGHNAGYAVRTRPPGEKKVIVADTMTGGAVTFLVWNGDLYMVNVMPRGNQDERGPLFSYEERPDA